MAKKLPKMIDMAMSKAERAKDAMPSMSGYVGDSSGEPIYPYGLSLSLGNEEIAKLGLGDTIEVGDMLELEILCKVTCVSKNQSTSGENKRIELQITHIQDDDDDAPEVKNTAKSLYKKG